MTINLRNKNIAAVQKVRKIVQGGFIARSCMSNCFFVSVLSFGYEGIDHKF